MPSGEVGFWAGFAVFFPRLPGSWPGSASPATCAIPGAPIPLGSISATPTGFAVYLVVPILLPSAPSDDELRDDPLVWSKIAPLGPWLVLPGLWSAIFSSAVGSMLAAPPHPAGARAGPSCAAISARRTGYAARAAAVAARHSGIAVCAVFLGDLNRSPPWSRCSSSPSTGPSTSSPRSRP